MKSLRISIVTPSFNKGRYIMDTIESVKSQNYPDIEHIVIDGGSSDNTLDILKKYSHLKWISENDRGPANAINKGFKLATGDIFAWINSDDYYEENVFQTVVNLFIINPRIDFVVGNLTIVDKFNNIILRDKTPELIRKDLITKSVEIRQPCSFFTRKIFQKVNGLNEKLHLTFDYDLFLRMFEYTTPFYIDKNLAYYRDYDETLTRKHVRRQAFEIFSIARKNGAKFNDRIMRSIIRKIITGRLW